MCNRSLGSDLLVAPPDNMNDSGSWGKIHIQGKKPIFIGSLYRNPSSNTEPLQSLEENLSRMTSGSNSQPFIILGGDFNLPSINWDTNSLPSIPQYGTTINRKFLDIIENFNLTQVVKEPTREGNILDLLLTTYPDYISNVATIPGMSDHLAVTVEFSIGLKFNKKKPRKIYLYKKGNIESIKDKIRALGGDHFNTNISIEDNWCKLRDTILDAIDQHIPSKTVRDGKHVPWLTSQIKRGIKKRKRLFNKAKKSGKEDDWLAFRKLRNSIRRDLDQAQNDYIRSILNLENLRASPKKFWSFISHKRKDKTGVPPLQSESGLVSDTCQKAEILNNHYGSVFTKDDTNNIPVMQSNPFPTMFDYEISAPGVLKLLKELNPHKASGPDKIPTYILRECAEEIAPILTRIFNQSIEEGTVPQDWLSANVCPVYKKGKRSLPINYRPISLTSVACKTLEHIIAHNIMRHIDMHKILKPYQHGFLKHHSCESQLINTSEEIMRHLDQVTGGQIDILVLDFSKAFDLVSHKKLLTKLDHYGVRGKTLNWLNGWISNQTQKVVIDGEFSPSIPVTSGVPQGTVLGPLMFLLYINDIGELIDNSTSIKLFADDCLLFRPIQTEQDQVQLQSDLDKLRSWAKSWQMNFNPTKCECLHITRSRTPKVFTYNLMGTDLKTVNQCRYLGIHITNTLTWNSHIDKITNDANRMLGVVKRNLARCDPPVKRIAYLALVRPKLEYASTVWDPHQSNHIHKLEMVQRRAARFIKSDYQRTSSVTAMLQDLQLTPLELRRRHFRLTMLFKALHEESAVDIPPYVTKAIRPRRDDNNRFTPLQCRTQAYLHSFWPQIIKNWNTLPIQTKNMSSTKKFQSSMEAN